MASYEAKKGLEAFLMLDEKLKLFDIEETLELRKDTSCIILIGVSSQRLGKAFCDYLSSIVDDSKHGIVEFWGLSSSFPNMHSPENMALLI